VHRDGALDPLIADLQRLHEQRVAADPDFQEAVAEIASIEKMREQKSVSLNLEKRRAERTSLTHDRLGRETGRPDTAGDEGLEEAGAAEDRPDAMLGEASQITADLAQIETRYVVGAKTGT
jgi:carboxyl-terminal processing protease